MNSVQIGVRAFRREWQQSAIFDQSLEFNKYAARRQRYEINWAYFKNNAYSDVHAWATSYRTEFAMYRYVRNIFNPARRLSFFWQGALMGGALDPEAGDGTAVKSALPIMTANDALRFALERLWRDSNMASVKDDYTLLGTIFGDTGWRVHDDPGRGKVTLQPLSPNMLYDVVKDTAGNVKAYTLVEPRLDPTTTTRQVALYVETATRDGDDVVYQTYKNDDLFAWDGIAAEWSIPYTFVPLVVVKHSGVNEWGESEYEDDLSKIREVDDLASALHDYGRKAVNAPMLLAGVDAPATKPTTRDDTMGVDSRVAYHMREQGRQEIPLFYGPAGAQPHPILADLDIPGMGARVDALIKEFQRDHPELQVEELRLSGQLTGRALELAREPAEIKGTRLRTNYDGGLVRAQQMAVAIGGWRGYDGYAGFNLDSYARGLLDHHIGERPIFDDSKSDTLEYKEKFWKIVVDTSPAMGRDVVLRDLGWSQEKIDEEFSETDQETAQTAPLVDEVTDALARFNQAMSEQGTGQTSPVTPDSITEAENGEQI